MEWLGIEANKQPVSISSMISSINSPTPCVVKIDVIDTVRNGTPVVNGRSGLTYGCEICRKKSCPFLSKEIGPTLGPRLCGLAESPAYRSASPSKANVSVHCRSLPTGVPSAVTSKVNSGLACLLYKFPAPSLVHLTHPMASSFPDPFVFGILPGMPPDASPAFSIAESESDFPAEFPLIPSLLDFLPSFDSFHATRPSFSAHINVPADPNPGWLPDPGSVSSRPARHFSPEDFGSHCLRRPASEFEVGVDALLPDLRRVLSAEDIQESRSKSIIDGVEEMGLRVCRYSPEEKKERIERYLKKKNLRNFNKTIKA
ncbi:hypothetical protein EJ110_NYTH47327 [Nymphaea thermarum]|nr:hypothetical protein EJ110_NYTH47327 [Nymphaea thermarum]